MTAPGTTARPLRVAIIGSGPAAFYAAEQLLAQAGITVEVDLFDRLPMPYGLVRFGVAPDHPRIKSVTRIFDRIASDPRVRFYGLVEFGRDVQLADLARHYHQVLYATGAAGDRRLGIPGESLAGVHSATAFVGWYNGHPDYREARFELTGANAVVVGMGNVAVDVTRILSTAPGALGRTDAADHAVEAFAHSRVRHVTMLGRRGPAQAAFTNPEIRELGELSDTDIEISPDDISPDEGSHAAPARGADRDVQRKLEVLRSLAQRPAAGRPRVIALRFLASPLEVIDDGTGRVAGVRLVRNALTVTAAGTLVARPTDRQEEIPAGLVLRAVGYRGTSLPGVPFNERWGVILNERGPCPRPSDDGAAARPVHRRLDQARADRRHRDEQAGRRRDRRPYDRGRPRRPHPRPTVPGARARGPARPGATASPSHLRRLAASRRHRTGAWSRPGPAARQVHDGRRGACGARSLSWVAG